MLNGKKIRQSKNGHNFFRWFLLKLTLISFIANNFIPSIYRPGPNLPPGNYKIFYIIKSNK